MSEAQGSNYRSEFTNDQLWKLVQKAAFTLSQARPEKLSTRKFDAGREALGEPDAPSGRWIAKRLGFSWPELVKIACDEQRDATMTDSASGRAPAEKWLDQRHLFFALRYVAEKRGAETFSAYDYDETRGELLKSEQHKPNGGPLRIILPTSDQIIQIVRRIEKAETEAAEKAAADAKAAAEAAAKDGGKPKKRKLLPELDEEATAVEELDETEALGWWSKALVLAGLDPYVQAKGEGVAPQVAIHLYIEATGKIPFSWVEVQRLAREGDFSLGSPRHTKASWTVKPYLPDVAAHRAKLGLEMAGEVCKRGEKPVFDLSKLPGDLPRAAKNQNYWADEEHVINALCEYLDTVVARNVRQITVDDYFQEQKKHRSEWPTKSTLGRQGPKSFPAWIEKARPVWKKRRQQKAA